MLPEGLAPGLTTLGVMMPYTPLHLLLFSGFFDCLVMTSGNYTDLPLAIDNDAALHELGRIADFFLIHNREIVNRCDDSLIRVIDGEAGFLRRSRGDVPYPISVKREDNSPVILGIGGEMKNNFCLLKDDMAFISQYIGEIDTLEGEKNLRTSLLNLQELIGVVPEIVAYDAHPDYASSKMAREIDAKAYIAVQHHHAHLASCMAPVMAPTAISGDLRSWQAIISGFVASFTSITFRFRAERSQFANHGVPPAAISSIASATRGINTEDGSLKTGMWL